MEQSSAYEGQPLHEPKGWWGRYVFSQDHKVIALQYTCIALVVLLFSLYYPFHNWFNPLSNYSITNAFIGFTSYFPSIFSWW